MEYTSKKLYYYSSKKQINKKKNFKILEVSSIIDVTVTKMENIIKTNENDIDYLTLQYLANCSFYDNNFQDFPLKVFMLKLINCLKMEASTIILMIKYVDRFCQSNSYLLTRNSVFNILKVAALLACKFNQDKTYTQVVFATILNINITKLNILEIHFLEEIKYRLFLSYESYLIIKDFISSSLELNSCS